MEMVRALVLVLALAVALVALAMPASARQSPSPPVFNFKPAVAVLVGTSPTALASNRQC